MAVTTKDLNRLRARARRAQAAKKTPRAAPLPPPPPKPKSGLLRALPGAALKTWWAMKLMAHQNGVTHVTAPISELAIHTGLVPDKVAKARDILIARKLIVALEGEGSSSFQFTKSPRAWLVLDAADMVKERIPRKKTAPKHSALYARGAARLGIPYLPTGQYARTVMTMINRRLTEGATEDELMAVVEWASERYERGDTFPPLKDLTYLWGRRFPMHLALAERGPA